MKTFANKYCDGFSLSKRQLNSTRVEHNPRLLPRWQRNCIQELCQKEQVKMFNWARLQEDNRTAHELKAFNLRERLRKKGMMTTWESRAASATWSDKNTPLTTSLQGMPSCHHCYKQHCPIRTIIAIAIPTSPTKDWVLSSKLFRKRNLESTNFSGNRWRKGSLFMGSHRVTVTAKWPTLTDGTV